MPHSSAINARRRRLRAHTSVCTDPVVGNILSGWRYDISQLSPEMRQDYELHFAECQQCRRRQRVHRGVDVLLISVTSLSIVAFLLAISLIHRVEAITHVGAVHVHLRQTAVAISLEAVAIAGLVISMLLWLLVAIATPLPGLARDMAAALIDRRNSRISNRVA